MKSQLLYQLRIQLPAEIAHTARQQPDDVALDQLNAVLARHQAQMKCQLDAFLDYVREAEAYGTDDYPLYEWTKATVENPAKQTKHQAVFTLHVDGQEVYPKAQADALEAELLPLTNSGLILRVAKYDTDPAHNPQPSARPA